MFSFANKLLIKTSDLPPQMPQVPSPKTPSSRPGQRSSSHSMHSPKSDEDSDDKFFDAIDNSLLGLSEKEVTEEEEEDCEDDRASCFFDTATSRHQSEISDYSAINSPLSPRQIMLSDCFDETDGKDLSNASTVIPLLTTSVPVVDEQVPTPTQSSIKIEISDTDSSENIEEQKPSEENEVDPELETPWTFWIDRYFEWKFYKFPLFFCSDKTNFETVKRCYRGTSKDQYEAGLRLIKTVNTVQVRINKLYL
jgi:hypothetical protein